MHSRRRFQIQKTIGEGSFAVIYKAIRLSDQLVVAVKRIRLSDNEFLERSETRFTDFKNEWFI